MPLRRAAVIRGEHEGISETPAEFYSGPSYVKLLSR